MLMPSLLARLSLLALVLVVSCRASDGAGAATDAAARDGRDGPAPVRSCAGPADCAAGEICGTGSKTCVPAVTAVACGTSHTCALHADGRVSCWGSGKFIVPELPRLSPPVFVDGIEGAIGIAVGAQAACARLGDGSARCWGIFAEQPDVTLAPATVVTEDGRPLAGITALAGGTIAFCALAPGGTYCWGDNQNGELARPQGTALPARTAVLAHPGAQKLLAASVAIVVHDGGRRLCGWGANDAGLVPGGRGVVPPGCADDVPDVRALSAGDGHVCAHRGGASFSCWGSNSGGQLGTGDDSLMDVPLPGMVRTLPGPIATIAAGGYHTCALLESGAVSCWGNNDNAQVGSPSSVAVFSPAPVSGFTAPIAAIGGGAESNHTCVVYRDGNVACWGWNDHGQLGDGVAVIDPARNSPRPIDVRF